MARRTSACASRRGRRAPPILAGAALPVRRTRCISLMAADALTAKRRAACRIELPHTVNPRTITVDKNPAYPAAVTTLKREGELWRFSRLRQVKYLNNIVEQDHRRIKRLVRPGLGFGSLPTARRTLAGYEGIAMIRKGQVRNVGGSDMQAQAAFVAGLFGIVPFPDTGARIGRLVLRSWVA